MANGLSKGMSIEDIAKKHKVDIDTLKQELKKGVQKEKEEHTGDIKRAARIAMDHLVEDPEYYTKLAKLNLEENKSISYIKPNFEIEWEEAIRYPEFEQIGKEKWLEIAKKGSTIKYSKIKDYLGNVDLDFKNLEEPKKQRFNKAFEQGKIEAPIVVKFDEDSYDLLAGNTRLSGLVRNNIDPTLWVVNIPTTINESQLNKDLVSEFMKHVLDELKLEKLPKITLSGNSQEAIDMKSWGGYKPSNKSIHIIIAKRHPADIFRTLAHELVHYKQDLEGRLKPESGATGSDEENEANSRAAVIMRNFAYNKPNLFEHLTKEGEYGDYLFGDKESGVKIGWYKDELEIDTPIERQLFNFLKTYADSEANTYSTINLDPYLENFRTIKKEYPEIGDTKLLPDDYIYRGTFISEEKARKLFDNPNKEETKDNIIIPNQEYSSRRKVSSWSTRYFPAASFAMTTAEMNGEGVPVVMRAKAGDAELFFNPRFMDKLSDQFEDEVINATNPIKVDIMLIKNYEDEFEDIESGYLSTK